jgi:hypothetical protein
MEDGMSNVISRCFFPGCTTPATIETEADGIWTCEGHLPEWIEADGLPLREYLDRLYAEEPE